MNRSRIAIGGLLGSLAIGGCSDAGAKRDGLSEMHVPAMWKVSTSSEEAAREARAGIYVLDVARPNREAHEHFERAIAADPGFTFGYLMAGYTAPSLQQQLANMERAKRHAAGASGPERLLLEMQQKEFQGDGEGALEIAERLVRADPRNARSWMVLGRYQSSLGREQAARASWSKAAELAPDLVGAALALANSYVFLNPTDLSKAEQQIQRAIQLAPQEGVPYDILGDLRRAQGRLGEASKAYSRAMDLDPKGAIFVQQRGHVHLLQGELEKALADYDAAVGLEFGNGKVVFARSRGLAYLLVGDRTTAVREMQQLVEAIDGLGIPEPLGMKIVSLEDLAQTSIHYGQFDLAEATVAQLADLRRRQASETGTEEFRRAREADIAFFDGLLAARKGDYALANQKAQEFMRLTEAVRNPRKNERAHLVMGMVALGQGKHAEAVRHFDQAQQWKAGRAQSGDPWEAYVAFHRALALEGAGRTSEAQQLFREISEANFVSIGVVLVRNEAKARLKA